MRDAGVHEGDMLVVDRSLQAKHGKMVVAAVDGQVTVKYLHIRQGKAFLVPANSDFREIPVNEENGVTVLGVVTRSIKTL